MESNHRSCALNGTDNNEICPRSKCHLYLTLQSKEVDASIADQFETTFGFKLDPWGTEVAKSHFICSWDINALIWEFISEIDNFKWEFLNDLMKSFCGDLLLSVEIWFHRPPAFGLGKELLRKAAQYSLAMDFDLYPVAD